MIYEEEASPHKCFMRIEKGPEEWQVLQQAGGFAEIQAEGTCRLRKETFGALKPYIRIVCEQDGSDVVTWTQCPITEDSRNDTAHWRFTADKIPAGGPYRLETGLAFEADGFSIEFLLCGESIHHFSVGNVIVVAGQSNAAGYARESVYDPPEYGISALRLDGTWAIASHPLHRALDGSIYPNADILNTGHSPWLMYAKLVKRHTGHPVGIIPAALGGSDIDSWNPQGGCLYSGMMKMIRRSGGKIHSMIWYQGCSDVQPGKYQDYDNKLVNLIAASREDLGDPELPFFIIQLNRCITAKSDERPGWRAVREAQRKAAALANVCCMPSYDLGSLSDDIHNSSYSNLAIAQRLFDMTKGTFDATGSALKAPDIKSTSYDPQSHEVVLSVANCAGKLVLSKSYKGLWPFLIEDEAGDEIEISGCRSSSGQILIKAETGSKAVFVSYVSEVAMERAPVYDPVTRLPLLGFDKIQIKTGDQ